MTANGQVRDIGKTSRYEDQLGIDIDKDGYGDQLPEITGFYLMDLMVTERLVFTEHPHSQLLSRFRFG